MATQLPDAGDVPVVSPRTGNVGTLRVPQTPSSGLETLAQGAQNLAAGQQRIVESRRIADERIAKAQKRIDDANNGLDRDRRDLEFQKRISESKTRLNDPSVDLADKSLIDAEAESLESGLQEILDGHVGDADSRDRLEISLRKQNIRHKDELMVKFATARRGALDSSLNQFTNSVTNAALNDREAPLENARAAIREKISLQGRSGPNAAASEAEEMEKVGKAVASKMIENEEYDAAQELMDSNPGMFAPSAQTQLRARINAGRSESREGVARILPQEEVATNFPQLPEGTIVEETSKGGIIIRFTPDQDKTTRSRKIAELGRRFQAMGVDNPEQKATDVVDGNIEIEVLENGDARLVDKVAAVTGGDAVTVIPISVPDPAQRTEIPSGETLFTLAENATGLRSAVLATTGKIPGTQVTESEEAVLDARSTFRTFQNDLARGLVNNPRFPVAERAAVLDAIDISPEVFDTPSAMRVRLKAADKFLRLRRDQFLRDSNDRGLPGDVQAAQRTNASQMQNAIDRLGIPQSSGADLDIEAINAMSPNDVRFVVNGMSEAEYNALPDEVKVSIGAALSPVGSTD